MQKYNFYFVPPNKLKLFCEKSSNLLLPHPVLGLGGPACVRMALCRLRTRERTICAMKIQSFSKIASYLCNKYKQRPVWNHQRSPLHNTLYIIWRDE